MRKSARLICAALIVIAVFSMIATTAFAVKREEYSSPSTLSKTELYADEFLTELGYELTEVERDFLHYDSDFLFSYNASIPTSAVNVDYSDGVLKVTAATYRYTASNGVEVVWTPISATACDVTKEFSQTARVLYFNDASEGDTVTVLYASDFVISAERVNELISLPYESVPTLIDHIDKKRAEYEKYLSDLDKYSEYVSALALYYEYRDALNIYNQKLDEYNEYLEANEEYKVLEKKYKEYVSAKKKYDADMKKYKDYLAYAEYNQAKIVEYENYLKNRDLAKYHLDIIKITKTPISVENAPDRTVYSAIKGDTVDRVIREKDLIVERLDGDEAVVDMAGEATKNLRNLLDGFFAIQNSAGQYAYYATNYTAFRDNFVNLLRALENLYCIPEIRAMMIKEDKHEKYLVLVAQLYYIANALSDAPIQSVDGSFYFDSSYVIGMFYKEDYKRTPVAAALGNQAFLEDKNTAAPLDTGYPTEPEKPEFLTMEEPKMPEFVQEPIPPDTVEEPKMPDVVLMPEEVAKPKTVEEYKAPATVLALIEAYEKGEISQREAYTGGDITLTPQIVVNKKYQNVEPVTVTFCYKESDLVEYPSITIDKGTSAEYFGLKPNKVEDAEYSYEFCGWVDENGNAVDLSSVESDITVYPKYTTYEQKYEVFWQADDELKDEYPGAPTLPELEYYEYDYGWGEPVCNTDDGTKIYYREKIESKPFVSAKDFVAKVYLENGKFSFALNSSVEVYDISNLIERAAGKYGITVKLAGGGEMSFSLAETISLKKAEVRSIRIITGSSLGIELLDGNGEVITSNAKFVIKAPFESNDPEHLRVFYFDGGEKVYARHHILSGDNGILSFDAVVGRIYSMRTEYSISVVPLDGIEIMLNSSTAVADEVIGVTVNAKPGIKLGGIYFESSDGTKEYINNSSFKMPARDVVVGAEYTVIVYTVSFVSDGRTLYTEKYTYGETVKVPDDPVKAPSAEYVYEFIGWSPEVKNSVTGDVTYFARYSKTPVPVTDDYSGGISGVVLKLLLMADIGAICILSIAIPSTVMRIIVSKKRKKYVFKLDNEKK